MASGFPGPIPGEQSNTLVARAKRLLKFPASEWPQIDQTPMTVNGIYTGWVIPLAAIGPVARLIGSQVFGYGAFGFSYRPSLMAALTAAVTGFLLALAGTFVLALIIDALAPSFGGTKNRIAALKVAAFSATAGWLAGIFQIIPALALLGLVGLYSFYLLWIGLPLLMKAPAEKAMAYFAVTLVSSVVVFVVIGALTASLADAFSRPPGFAGATADGGTVSGSIDVPGMGKVDLGKLNEASKRMEAAAAKMQADAASGKVTSIPAAALQALLPASIGGFTRGDTESASGGAAGIGGSTATGRYTSGDQSFSLTISDAGAMGALATMGGALNVESNKNTANGYEKTVMVGGAMVNEKWDNADRRGSYQTMAASRFIVAAEGNAPGIDTLKQAVAAVDAEKLAALAK